MYGGQTQSIQRLRRVMDFINGNNNCNSPVPQCGVIISTTAFFGQPPPGSIASNEA